MPYNFRTLRVSPKIEEVLGVNEVAVLHAIVQFGRADKGWFAMSTGKIVKYTHLSKNGILRILQRMRRLGIIWWSSSEVRYFKIDFGAIGVFLKYSEVFKVPFPSLMKRLTARK